MSRGRAWVKLWARWYESSSHALLSPRAMHTGPHLLVLARDHVEEDGTAWLIGPHGKPYTLDELATLTRWPKRAVKTILEELVRVGTMVRDNERYGFPAFEQYQESPSASRMRGWRSRQRHSDGHCDAKRDASVTTEDRRQKTEAEDRGRDPPKPPASPSSLDDRAESAFRLLAQEALIYGLDEAPRPNPPRQPNGRPRARLTPSYPPTFALLRDLMAAPDATVRDVVAEILRNVEAWARLADAGKVDARQWSGTRLLTPNGYQRLLREIENGGADDRIRDPTVGHYQHTGDEDYAGGEVEI